MFSENAECDEAVVGVLVSVRNVDRARIVIRPRFYGVIVLIESIQRKKTKKNLSGVCLYFSNKLRGFNDYDLKTSQGLRPRD